MKPVLKMEGITKNFPGVKALDQVSLELEKGEVHALLGENGAGKSTLMKILVGIHKADQGKILYQGKEMNFHNAKDAEKAGIGIVYQEFNLIPELTVAENIYFGRQPKKNGRIDWKQMKKEAEEVLNRLGSSISADAPIKTLGTAQQQMVEIAKVMSTDAQVVVFDEPTASLTDKEIEKLFQVIRGMKEKGITMIYISHRLEEIYKICDRATIMRDGKWIETFQVKEKTMDEMIALMVGRELTNLYPKTPHKEGNVVLEVKGLKCGRMVKDVSFYAKRGEILGFAGLMGAGRTETMRAIFGADMKDGGEVKIDGKSCDIRHPQEGIKNGIGFLTEDRKNQGLILSDTIEYNISLTNLDKITKKKFGLHILDLKKEKENAQKLSKELTIKTPSILQKAGNLSGGNQQKVVLAKWMNRACKILVFDEPTRGIDVGAKFEIYKLMNDLVAQGVCIIMISSDLPEVIGMSDRIYVMHEGTVTGELHKSEFDQDTILKYASGI